MLRFWFRMSDYWLFLHQYIVFQEIIPTHTRIDLFPAPFAHPYSVPGLVPWGKKSHCGNLSSSRPYRKSSAPFSMRHAVYGRPALAVCAYGVFRQRFWTHWPSVPQRLRLHRFSPLWFTGPRSGRQIYNFTHDYLYLRLLTWLPPSMLLNQLVYNYPYYHHYYQVDPLEVGGSFKLPSSSLGKLLPQVISLPHLSLEETQEKRVVWCTWHGEGEADQRDAPTACLILSYVSRLNGPFLLSAPSRLSFLSEGGAHKHSSHLGSGQVTAASSEQERVTKRKLRNTTSNWVWKVWPRGTSFIRSVLGSNVSRYHYRSVAHQQSGGVNRCH